MTKGLLRLLHRSQVGRELRPLKGSGGVDLATENGQWPNPGPDNIRLIVGGVHLAELS